MGIKRNHIIGILLFAIIAGLGGCKVKETDCMKYTETVSAYDGMDWIEISYFTSDIYCNEQKDKEIERIVGRYGSRKGGTSYFCSGIKDGNADFYQRGQTDSCPLII